MSGRFWFGLGLGLGASLALAWLWHGRKKPDMETRLLGASAADVFRGGAGEQAPRAAASGYR